MTVTDRAAGRAEATILAAFPDRTHLVVFVWHNEQGWYVSAGKEGGRIHLVTNRHPNIEAAIEAAVAKLKAQ